MRRKHTTKSVWLPATAGYRPTLRIRFGTQRRSLWLIEQVGSSYPRCTQDYSHLWLEDHDLQDCLEALLQVSLFIHVKDASGSAHKHRYLLPGDCATDCVLLFSILKKHGYDGLVNVEVGGHVHKQPGDDQSGTARLCYEPMLSAFKKAGLSRP